MRKLVIGDIHGNYKALLDVLIKCNYSKEDTLILLGDYCDGYPQSFEVIDYLNKIYTLANVIPIRGNHDCLDEETEIFTQKGWKKYTDLSKNDLIISINSKTGLAEWQNINEIIIKKAKALNYYSNTQIDFAVTDNHRILYFDKEYKYKKCSEILSNDRLQIPLSSIITNTRDYYLSDEQIKLVAWILTDGCITKNRKEFIIYQSKPENIEYIKSILNTLKLNYSVTKRQRNNQVINGKKVKHILPSYKFFIKIDDSKKLCKELFCEKNKIPNWWIYLSNRQLLLFLEEIIRGDGSWYKKEKNTAILYGTKRFLDEIQPLFILAGYSAKITQSNRKDFRLNISKKKFCAIRQDLNKIVRKEGNFNVWCINVDNGNFLVRRNNKPYFTGNCWLINYLNYGLAEQLWLKQGGRVTYIQYAGLIPSNVVTEHLNFLDNGTYYYYLDNPMDLSNCNVYVHGGYYDQQDISEQSNEEYMWNRELTDIAKYRPIECIFQGKKFIPKNVFIGHTSTMNWKTDQPIQRNNLINLDTGCGYAGKLTIMDVNTKEYWQSELASSYYPGFKHT